MNYTALGATVNLAARLEGLNKDYGTSILVSSSVKQRAGSRFCFRRVDCISPKGFAEAFEIYELQGEATAEHLPAMVHSARSSG
jgi:adenylate cyclase